MTQGRRIALVLLSLWGGHPAVAEASAICETLRARLASTPEIISNNREVRRYSSAITKQNFEIRKARQDMYSLGCGSGSIVRYGSNGQDACGELSSALRRMEDNKQILTAKRDSLQGGRGEGANRSRLLAALETNGCNAEPLQDAMASIRPLEGPRQPRSLTHVPSTGPQSGINPDLALQNSHIPAGPLRTMCVSTCDGSFFPISSGTSPINFQRDAAQCSQMCPGAQTELFYHSLMTQESADMVSAATGEPYRSLPKAFSYLNRSPGEKSECSCNLADYHRRVLQSQKPAEPETYSSITAIRGTVDPEPTARAAELPVQPERPYDPAASTVRQIGPSFLPAETSSIDLQHPANPGPQPVQQ